MKPREIDRRLQEADPASSSQMASLDLGPAEASLAEKIVAEPGSERASEGLAMSWPSAGSRRRRSLVGLAGTIAAAQLRSRCCSRSAVAPRSPRHGPTEPSSCASRRRRRCCCSKGRAGGSRTSMRRHTAPIHRSPAEVKERWNSSPATRSRRIDPSAGRCRSVCDPTARYPSPGCCRPRCASAKSNFAGLMAAGGSSQDCQMPTPSARSALDHLACSGNDGKRRHPGRVLRQPGRSRQSADDRVLV